MDEFKKEKEPIGGCMSSPAIYETDLGDEGKREYKPKVSNREIMYATSCNSPTLIEIVEGNAEDTD